MRFVVLEDCGAPREWLQTYSEDLGFWFESERKSLSKCGLCGFLSSGKGQN